MIRRDEPLAKHTTLRVGGPADLYVEPASEAGSSGSLGFCRERGRPFFVLGRGSNLLVRDGGFRGRGDLPGAPRISAGSRQPASACAAGPAPNSKRWRSKPSAIGLAGLEFLEGIPGSVGGALRMNAGAMGGAMFDVVESVRLMDFDGTVHERPARELSVAYRCCPISEDPHRPGGGAARPARLARGHRAADERVQPEALGNPSPPRRAPAACSRTQPSIPAGKLIDELGLKGTRVGGAVVSAEHGNFIVNDGTRHRAGRPGAHRAHPAARPDRARHRIGNGS